MPIDLESLENFRRGGQGDNFLGLDGTDSHLHLRKWSMLMVATTRKIGEQLYLVFGHEDGSSSITNKFILIYGHAGKPIVNINRNFKTTRELRYYCADGHALVETITSGRRSIGPFADGLIANPDQYNAVETVEVGCETPEYIFEKLMLSENKPEGGHRWGAKESIECAVGSFWGLRPHSADVLIIRNRPLLPAITLSKILKLLPKEYSTVLCAFCRASPLSWSPPKDQAPQEQA